MKNFFVAALVLISGFHAFPQSSCGQLDETSFAPPVHFSTAEAESYFTELADLDQDGKRDLAVANYAGNTVSVFRNTGTPGVIDPGTFSERFDFVSGARPSAIVAGDIDGDGKPDLAVTHYTSNTLVIFRNRGTGPLSANTFPSKIIYETNHINPAGVAIADLDSDGRQDIVVANNAETTVTVYRNITAPGADDISLAPGVDFETGANPLGVRVGDVDLDGKPDLVIANGNSNTISIHRNIATPGEINATSFEPGVDFQANGSPVGPVALNDLDGDGKPDIAVVNLHQATVSVLRNTTTPGVVDGGSFASRVDFSTGHRPTGIDVADLDGDGKAELAVAMEATGVVSVYRNTTTHGVIDAGSFAARIDYPTKPGYTYVPLIGDVDGDGAPDLIVGNGDNSVSVLRMTKAGATFTTSNSHTYFGYTDDQSATLTVTPSGGVGPYTVTILMNRALVCNAGNADGDERWLNLDATTTTDNTMCPASGSSPGSATASGTVTAGGSFSIEVMLMADARFTATVSDASGCVTVLTLDIQAEDVRCFAGKSSAAKIKLCHRTDNAKNPCVSICVDEAGLSDHLAHGDFVGSCTEGCADPANARLEGDDRTTGDAAEIFFVEAWPNPAKSSLTVAVNNPPDHDVTIGMLDARGGPVNVRSTARAKGVYELETENIPAGLYLLRVSAGYAVKTLKVIKD